jgi:ABC-type molybdenum transport system ATPase subunit/photorepair protein PhrA
LDKTKFFAFTHIGYNGRSTTDPVPIIDKKKDTNDQVIVYHRKTTNWYVITGGPGSGKTTTINLLKARGFKVTIEHARYYLDTQLIKGKTVEEVRSNQQLFQLGILEMQLEQEASLAPEDVVFLDSIYFGLSSIGTGLCPPGR